MCVCVRVRVRVCVCVRVYQATSMYSDTNQTTQESKLTRDEVNGMKCIKICADKISYDIGMKDTIGPVV